MKIIKYLLLPLFIVLIFFMYSFLSFTSPLKFTSPDESVNRFFIDLYAKEGSFRYSEPLNMLADGYVRPRNAVAVKQFVSPSTFLGMYIVYGPVSAIIPWITPYITPLLAILGGLFIFIISYILFDEFSAILSVFLFFILPPYWYWANMGYFNNMAATVFFLGGIAFLMLSLKQGKLVFYITAALLFGLNQIIRFTDLTYFLPIIFLILPFIRKINFKYVAIAVFFYLLTIAPVFMMNKQLYGSYLSFGYNSASSVVTAGQGSSIINKITFFLLPSGIRSNMIVYSFFTYLIKLVPLIILISIFGIVQSKKRNSSLIKGYYAFAVFLTVWILIYYGSGIFWGNEYFTLDASYIRYFLPIYCILVPIFSNFILKLPKNVAVVVVSIYAVISVISVFTLNNGLIDISQKRKVSEELSHEIISKTESDSLIITTQSDKLLFPERKVMVYGPVYNTVPPYVKIFSYGKLVDYITALSAKVDSIYIYNDRFDLDMNRVNNLLANRNLTFQDRDNNQILYKLKKTGNGK